MKKFSFLFILFAILLTTCLLTANIVAVKIISLFGLFVPAGIIIFPISYILGDILTEVYGYESPACLESLISLMVGITEKDPIPAVKLFTFDNGRTFQIPYTELYHNDGGHHRALAPYLLGENLEIEVVEQVIDKIGKMEIPGHLLLTLDQIPIESNPQTFHYEKDIEGKFYRELPSPEVFFGKYPRINSALRIGTGRDFSLNVDSYTKVFDRVKAYEERRAHGLRAGFA